MRLLREGGKKSRTTIQEKTLGLDRQEKARSGHRGKISIPRRREEGDDAGPSPRGGGASAKTSRRGTTQPLQWEALLFINH